MTNLQINDLEGEIWKDVLGWEGYYQVSNMGRVKSFGRIVIYGIRTRHTKDRILKPSKRPDNYYVIWFMADGRKEIHNLHRLIAETFIHNDDPINKNDVDHINHDSLDNRVDNLRWTTRKENLNNRERKKSGIQKIICVTTKEEFNTLKEAGEKYNLAYFNIASCCKGYSKTCGIHPETGEKLVWKYYKDYIKEIEKSAEDKIGLAN